MLILLLEYQHSSRFFMLKIIHLEDSLSWLNPQEINVQDRLSWPKLRDVTSSFFSFLMKKNLQDILSWRYLQDIFPRHRVWTKKVLQNFSTKSGLAVWMRPISILGGPISCKQSLKTKSTRLLVSRSKRVRHERLFLRN